MTLGRILVSLSVPVLVFSAFMVATQWIASR